MEYFLAIKMNEALIQDTDEFEMHNAKWKELTQKATYTVWLFIQNSRKGTKQLRHCQGSGGGRGY